MNIITGMFPVFLLVLTGWFLAKIHFLKIEIETYLNKIIFDLTLPAIMFVSIDQYGIKNILNINFAIGYTLSILVPFLLAFIIFKCLRRQNTSECIFIGMNASISNSGLIGMPILLGIFGVVGGIPIAAILTICSILIIPLLILWIECSEENLNPNKFLVFANALKRTTLQPFILATTIAVLLNLFSIKLPKSILTYLQYLSDLTIPCALIAVGIRLSLSKIITIKPSVILVSLLNLIIKPAIALSLALILHLSKLYGIALMVVSAAPVANSIYIFSAKYNVYKSESAEISFLTMVLSIATLPFFLWIASKYWA